MASTCRISLALLFVTAGCSLFIPPECRYLKVAQDRAITGEVQQKLGMPIEKMSLQTGEALWRYEVLEEQPTHRGTPTGFWCDEYQLTFDKDSVLREWTHRSFFHGGELRPEPCRAGYERLALCAIAKKDPSCKAAVARRTLKQPPRLGRRELGRRGVRFSVR